MAKKLTGTFVIQAKLKGTKTTVYCGGLSSDNLVIWTTDVSCARKIKDPFKADLESYVSQIWRHNDRYNAYADSYAVSFNVLNLDKKPCSYLVLLGSINSKSSQLGIFPTTQQAARFIAIHAKNNYPRVDYFLYKKTTSFPEGYCPFKYDLIDKHSGEHLKTYYFIKEVSTNV